MALGQLAFPLHPLDAQKVHHFPLGDVKAQAKLIIELHTVFHRLGFGRLAAVSIIASRGNYFSDLALCRTIEV
jgi:hypothetical protein